MGNSDFEFSRCSFYEINVTQEALSDFDVLLRNLYRILCLAWN